MPNIKCPQIISCPGSDSPFQNWTSEQPDKVMYVGLNWGWDHNDPPLGPWTHSSCFGICISTLSQEDADLCAAANNLFCLSDCNTGDPACGDGGGGPQPIFYQDPDIVTYPIFFSGGQSCTVNCPDGSPFTYVLPAGVVAASSQEMADRIAHSIACTRAGKAMFCLISNFGDFFCNGETLIGEPTIAVSGPGSPFTIKVTSGQLPTGISFIQDSGNTGIFYGTFTTPGTYVFTLSATNAENLVVHKILTVAVFGITNTSLTDGAVGSAYSAQLLTDGGVSPVTFSGTPPAGLTLSSSGAISGTPTTATSTPFDVTITDGNGNHCIIPVTLVIVAGTPCALNALSDGTVGTFYSGFLNAAWVVPPRTFTLAGGTLPPGTDIIGVAVQGTPTTAGTYNFTVHVVDSGGHDCYAPLSILVNPFDCLGVPALAGLVWTGTLPDGPGCASVAGAGATVDLSVTLDFAACLNGTVTAHSQICNPFAGKTITAHFVWTLAVFGALSPGAICNFYFKVGSVGVPTLVSVPVNGPDSGVVDIPLALDNYDTPALLVALQSALPNLPGDTSTLSATVTLTIT